MIIYICSSLIFISVLEFIYGGATLLIGLGILGLSILLLKTIRDIVNSPQEKLPKEHSEDYYKYMGNTKVHSMIDRRAKEMRNDRRTNDRRTK